MIIDNRKKANPLKDKKLIMEEVEELCSIVGISNVREWIMENDEIKMKIKRNEKFRLWQSTKDGVFNVKRERVNYGWKPYHRYEKREGRAVLLWRCGALYFRRYWRTENEKKKIQMTCPFWLCGEEDTFEHARVCKFMYAKVWRYSDESWEDFCISEFIMRLDHERKKRFGVESNGNFC